MWNVQILMKYRSDWTVDEPSCSFTFGEEGELKGKLRQESGNGWQACINMSHEVRHHQAVYTSTRYVLCTSTSSQEL